MKLSLKYNRKKILHIINGEFYSGAERVQDLIASRLPHLGYDILLACIKPGLFKEHCRCDINQVYEFPMRSKFDLYHGYKIS